jgi:mono/diheme cytochrome c family protein
VACHGSNGQGTPLAPALNDATLRAERTAEQLTTTISLGVAGTVMAGWNQRLTAEQIGQLVVLIQRWGELPAEAIPEPPAQPLIVTEKLLETGAALYTQTCARCHGPEGQGTPRAPALNVQSFFQKVTTDAAMIQIVTSGVPGTAMPAWGDRLSPSEIEAVTAFVRAWEATAPAVAQPRAAPGGGPPWRQNNTAPNAPQPPHGATTAPATAFDWRSGLLLGAVGVSVSAALISSSAALWKLRWPVSPAPAPRLNE